MLPFVVHRSSHGHPFFALEVEVRVCGISGGFVGILFRLYQGHVCVVW